MSTTPTAPEVVVGQDYDGYFERLVRGWIERKLQSGAPFKHARVNVTAGPYRPYAVTFEQDEEQISLDFYSALRTGFGSLSLSEIDQIIALL